MTFTPKQKPAFDAPAKPEADEQPPAEPIIAQDDTMTASGLTVGQMVEAAKMDKQRLQGELDARDATIQGLNETVSAKNAKIDELVEYSKKKNAEIGELKIDLGVARLAKDSAKAGIPAGLERLPGGGIRLAVTLDVDEATPLLSWAEGAQEDPATYIAAQIKDALVAVTSS